MKKYSNRIIKICEHVPSNNHTIYDLCCDHGHIGMNLHQLNTEREIVFIDKVPSIVKALHSYIPKRENLVILKEDATKFKITTNQNIFIIAGIGAELASDIFKNLYFQSPNSSFLFCIHQKTEFLKEVLLNENLRLIRNDFIIDKGQGYEVFLVSKTAEKEIKVFDPEIYDYTCPNQKKYINDLKNYYKTKLEYAPQDHYRKYVSQLDIIYESF